jgi:hypothetical protein
MFAIILDMKTTTNLVEFWEEVSKITKTDVSSLVKLVDWNQNQPIRIDSSCTWGAEIDKEDLCQIRLLSGTDNDPYSLTIISELVNDRDGQGLHRYVNHYLEYSSTEKKWDENTTITSSADSSNYYKNNNNVILRYITPNIFSFINKMNDN